MLHNEGHRLHSQCLLQKAEHLICVPGRIYMHRHMAYHGKFFIAKSPFPLEMIFELNTIGRILIPPVSLFDLYRIHVEEDGIGFLMNESAGPEEGEDGMALAT